MREEIRLHDKGKVIDTTRVSSTGHPYKGDLRMYHDGFGEQRWTRVFAITQTADDEGVFYIVDVEFC